MSQGMDLDPLSTYEYPTYNSYHSLNNAQINHLPPYPYQHVKQEDTYYSQPIQNNTGYTTNNIPETIPQTEQILEANKSEQPNEESDVKPDINKKKKDKKNGRNFCSQKITDASYPFYGCSVCNISYTALHELDQHVTVHKNRMTSYRLRLRNQFKKKQIKKEKKKLKKLKKIKQETEIDIEIKPEDGYIGSEKTADYVNNGDSNTVKDKEINGTNSVSEDLSKGDENSGAVSSQESCKSNDKDADDAELNNLEKIYKCFACQKQFTLSYYLKLHVRSHTGGFFFIPSFFYV